MIKFFVRILKFSGKYRGRVLSAALFAFIKGICIMMPLFLGLGQGALGGAVRLH